jgi:hypothetical protein
MYAMIQGGTPINAVLPLWGKRIKLKKKQR